MGELTVAEQEILSRAGLVEPKWESPDAFEQTRVEYEQLLLDSLSLEQAAELLGMSAKHRAAPPSRADDLRRAVRRPFSWYVPRVQFNPRSPFLLHPLKGISLPLAGPDLDLRELLRKHFGQLLQREAFAGIMAGEHDPHPGRFGLQAGVAASGAIGAALQGGNVGIGGPLPGGVSAGVAEDIGGAIEDTQWFQHLAPVTKFAAGLGSEAGIGAVTGGITSEMVDGHFVQGMGQGAWTAAYGFIFNQAMHAGKEVLQVDNPLAKIPTFSESFPRSNFAAPAADIISGGLGLAGAVRFTYPAGISYLAGPEFWWIAVPAAPFGVEAGNDAINRITVGIEALGGN